MKQVFHNNLVNLLSFPIFCWGHFIFFLEVVGEDFRCIEAYLISYFSDCHLRLFQEFQAFLEPDDAYELTGRTSGNRHEFIVQVATAHSDDTAEFFY